MSNTILLPVFQSNTLLSDNEYRLLRENLFKQDMTGRVIPVELPIVPVASPPTCESVVV